MVIFGENGGNPENSESANSHEGNEGWQHRVSETANIAIQNIHHSTQKISIAKDGEMDGAIADGLLCCDK